MILKEMKLELNDLRDDCDKLVKCLQEASQAESLEDFLAGIVCADEKTIILSADLFDLLSTVNRAVPPEGLAKKPEPKGTVEAVEPLKSEVIEMVPVVEAKVETVAEPIVEPVVEVPKTIVEVVKAEEFKEEIKSETV